MRLFGLIGKPLGHSFSAGYFKEKFSKEYISDAAYQNFEIEHIDAFPQLLEDRPDLCGLNVTIPYKESVLPHLTGLSDAAKAIGAVNCIHIQSGKLVGHNTDYLGFLRSLKPLLKAHHKQALILGTGGSSKAVAYALDKLGIEYTFVSREPKEGQLSYEEISTLPYVIINTTPLGMRPLQEHKPALSYEQLTDKHLLFDLIYNPEETLFLEAGKAAGAITKNGLEMLKIQAEESWKIWGNWV